MSDLGKTVLAVFCLILLYFAGNHLLWLMNSVAAPTATLAAKAVVAHYFPDADPSLTPIEQATPNAPFKGERTVIFKDKENRTRFEVDLKPVPFRRWHELRYQRYDPPQ